MTRPWRRSGGPEESSPAADIWHFVPGHYHRKKPSIVHRRYKDEQKKIVKIQNILNDMVIYGCQTTIQTTKQIYKNKNVSCTMLLLSLLQQKHRKNLKN